VEEGSGVAVDDGNVKISKKRRRRRREEMEEKEERMKYY